jgi:aryl-alcohol dehydrogenase-like predicted oxidoreductase
MAYGPMAHGLLTGAFTHETTFEENDWRRRGLLFGQALFTPENFPTNIAVVEHLAAVASDLEVSLARLAIAWVLRDPLVAVALFGTRRPQEIDENVKAVDIELSDEALSRIDQCMTHVAGQTQQLPVPSWT